MGANRHRIRIVGHNGEPIDPSDGPIWRAIAEEIESLGYELELSPIGSARRLHGLIALNHRPPTLSEAVALAVPVRRRTLVLFEPRVTDPVAHAARTLDQYGQVLAPSPLWPHSDATSLFNWPNRPMGDTFEPLTTWVGRRNAGLMVQWNKFSAVTGEQYSLRRRVIALADRQGVPLDLVGPAWDATAHSGVRNWIHSAQGAIGAGLRPDLRGLACIRPPLRRYRGSVDDKGECTSRYRVAVCIENSCDYVSEKLFDAIREQTLPIYVGPEPLLPEELQRAGIVAPPDPAAIVARIGRFLAMDSASQHSIASNLLRAARLSDADRAPVRVFSGIVRTAVKGWDTR